MSAKISIFFTALRFVCSAGRGRCVSWTHHHLRERTSRLRVPENHGAFGGAGPRRSRRPGPECLGCLGDRKGQGTLVGTVSSTDANGLASTYFVGTATYPESFTTQAITATAVQGSATFYVTSVLSRNLESDAGCWRRLASL